MHQVQDLKEILNPLVNQLALGNMKKHLYIIALFVFAIVSCISNMEVGSPFTEGQEVTITASLANNDSDTKQLPNKHRVSGKDAGTAIDLTWNKGDEILVTVGNKSAIFTLSLGENTSFGTFTGKMPADGNEYSVSYPADYRDDVLINQTYVENGFDNGLMKMSTRRNGTLEGGFLLTADNAVLGLQFKGDAVVNKIVLTNRANNKTYTLDCSKHEVSIAGGRLFYIVIPAGTWSNGMKVEMYNKDNVVIFSKEKDTEIQFLTTEAMIMPELEVHPPYVDLEKTYYYGLTDQQFADANAQWNSPNMGWGLLDQSPIQGKMLRGIRIKVARAGKVNLYKVPSLKEDTENNFQLAATISTDKTGLQDIEFEKPFYLEDNLYLVIGKHSDAVSLVGLFDSKQSNIQPFCNRIGQSGGINSSQSFMIDFY